MNPRVIQNICPKCKCRRDTMQSYEVEDYEAGYTHHFRMTCQECRHVWYESHD